MWGGVAGSPYYTNLYCLGPLSTNNGVALSNAWREFLLQLASLTASGMTAQIDSELLEFDETTGVVTGTGTLSQPLQTMTGLGDQLPHMTQALIQWSTNGIVHNRRVRGRTFIPGVLEAHNSATGAPLPGVGTPLQAAVDTFLSTMSGRLRIWSREVKAEQATATVPARLGSAHAVSAGKVAPYWAVLRSRRD